MIDRIHLDIIAYHGWGYDSSSWRAWEAAFAQPGCRFQRFDRGYFGSPFAPTFAAAAAQKIILAHSYGLHLCPPAQLQQADTLILFSSFITFYPDGDRAKKRAVQILDQMVRQFELQPEFVLSNFRAKCDDPIDQIPFCNSALLLNDLKQLGTSTIDLDLLAKIPQILVLHGECDRIVSPAQGNLLHQKLSSSHACLIKNAGHALPFTHDKDCLAFVQQSAPTLVSSGVKPQIAAEFGRSPVTYHAQAELQKYCADRLIALLDQHAIPAGEILEIGCGTGFVTQKLIDRFPGRSLHITDLSSEMLSFCRDNLDRSRFEGAIAFEQLDGETLNSPKRYALIVAGFVVQWFQQPLNSIQRLLEHLEPHGWLLVAFPSCGSFLEWKAMCDRLQLPFTANPLPEPQLLARLTAANCWLQTETIATTFTDAAEFFRGLKAIGAGLNTCGKQLSAAQMRQLIRAWNRECGGAIEVRHHVVYGRIQRL